MDGVKTAVILYYIFSYSSNTQRKRKSLNKKAPKALKELNILKIVGK